MAPPAAQDRALRVRGSDILGKRELLDREYRVKRYDFRRPDKFSKEQIRTVQIVHETFSRLAETALSGLLRQAWTMHVSSVDQMTYGEFINSVETPSLLAVAKMHPLRGLALLQVDRSLHAAWLDRLYGGAEPPEPEETRPLSFIELASLEPPIRSLLGCLRESWTQLLDLAPALDVVETNPRFCQIVPPTEMILLVTFEAACGKSAGLANLVVPYLTIEPLIPKLSARYWYSMIRRSPLDRPLGDVARRLASDAQVLARGEPMSLVELSALRPGSLVRLPGLDAGRCRLRLGGEELLELEPRGTVGRGGTLRFGARRFGTLRDAETPPPAVLESVAEAGLELAAVERGFESIRLSLERGLETLGGRILGLEGRQEAMADRIEYGQGDAAAAGPSARPFAALASVPADAIAAALGKERPQLAALVLSRLDDALAAGVLEGLDEAIQPEAVRRLGAMGQVLPEILAAVDRQLCRQLDASRTDRSAAGGVEKIVGILNLSARATEKHVVDTLERTAPALAEDVKRNMFVFEDISLLDDESLRAVAERADRRDLLAAMKPVSEKLRERIFARFGEEEARRLRQEYERLGKLRLSESDAAGMRVVAVVRELEREGRIFIEPPGPGEGGGA